MVNLLVGGMKASTPYDQGRQRHPTRDGAREGPADGQPASGALFHCDGRAGECLGAVWTRHMRAVVQFSDGTEFTDSDHLFTTGAIDPAQAPTITASTSPGMTPQSGVELLDLVSGYARPTIADLRLRRRGKRDRSRCQTAPPGLSRRFRAPWGQGSNRLVLRPARSFVLLTGLIL